MAPDGGHQSTGRSRKALPVDGLGRTHIEPDPGHEQSEQDMHADASAHNTEPVEDETADVIMAEHPGQDRQRTGRSRQWREWIRDNARSFFGPRSRQAQAEHARQRRIDDERTAWADEGLSERQQLLKLRSQVRLAGDAYMQSLKDSNLIVPGYEGRTGSEDLEAKGRRLDAKNQVYMQMMMQSCLTPLRRGVRPASIIQAAGMVAAMRMLSPDFRDELGEHTGKLKEKIQERGDRKIKARVAAIQKEIGQREALFSNISDHDRRVRLVGSTDVRDHLSKNHRERFDAIQRRERGQREVFTPESAALTEVALLEDAYWTMRAPDTDNNEVRRGYRAMRKRLHAQMADDGLERQEVVTRARVILGERMDHEPELRAMLNGFAHGRIVKSPPHKERIAGTDSVRTVWSGEVEDQLGNRVPDDGMFTLREPMNADAHQVALAETMETSIMHGASDPDRSGLRDSMLGYMVGFAVRRQGRDTRDLPDSLRARVEQSEVMIASMAMDGLPPDEQRRVYSNAFADAIQAVGNKDPEFAHDLSLALGKDWLERLQRAVDDPGRFWMEQQYRPRVWQQGPGRSDRGFAPGEQQPDGTPETNDYQPA